MKVLIILDDVDHDDQVKSLAGDREWFGIGSKIIITSRNRDILIAEKVDEIYEPNVMASDDSLKLFSHYAFGRDQPPKDYLNLSEAIVKTTGRLPLALQVIGSSLCSKKPRVWEEMLKKLQQVPNNDVMKRLQISYDHGLDDEQQQMFLDIACFFVGLNKDIACHIWDGCGFSSQIGLDSLCARSLVMINEKDEIRIHDQLRDLGRKIVHQENKDDPGKRTRIWSQDEVLAVLDTQTGTSNVKGLSIDFKDVSNSQCLMSDGFSVMTRLRLLQVDYAHSSGDFTHSFSELRWLSWKGCLDQYAQANFYSLKLAVLDLSYSKITKDWMCWNYIKMAVNLKVLNLTSCDQLSRIPDLSANRLLEMLILKDCSNLDEIDTSISCLRKLLLIDLSGCPRLKDLPSEISQLTSLKRLDLGGCRSLEKLPEKLVYMTSLTTLVLESCTSLKSLPNLPRTLKSFEVYGCASLTSLPMLSSLKNLEKLSILMCEEIRHIPALPSSLTSLNVRFCFQIGDIPALPSSLTSFGVVGCISIRYIPDPPSSLTHLRINHCSSVVKLSSTPSSDGVLRNLKTLHLDDCKSLEEIEGVNQNLDSLEVLDILCCDSFKTLPKLIGSKNLRTIKLYGNDLISKFEGKGRGMDSLVELDIWYCKSLRKIPYLRDSKNLRILKISHCPKLSKIERLEDYESLQELSIEATSLKTLPDNISTLKNLRFLGINGCERIERLPDLSDLKKELRQLEIEGWWRLTQIPGLDRLESLQKLKTKGCIAIQRLPDLSNFNKLNDLNIEGCKNLTEIHGIDRLGFLEKLNISGCELLEILPDLSNSKKLKELRAYGCKKLKEIQAENGLESLEELDVRGCLSLQKFPDLTMSKDLRVLNGNSCSYLTNIDLVEHLMEGAHNYSR